MANTSYSGQQHDGEIELFPGEMPGGIFTEHDRRRAEFILGELGHEQTSANTAIEAVTVYQRLSSLAIDHGSYTAAYFLSLINVPKVVELVESHGGIDQVLGACAPRDRSGLVVDYDNQVSAFMRLEATIN